MRVSLNQIKQFVGFDLSSVSDVVQKINQQLGGVEEVVDLASRYAGATIVKVETCEKHSNADKLNVCQVDDGSGELVQIVCGAPNVHAGMYAVWLKPGMIVPSTANDKEPFVFGARELRGVMSNGMLASVKELGLGDSHDGILELNPDEWIPSDSDIKPGTSFAEVYGLDDTIIEIENKMFTHRPDLFGQLGVAREIAGIHHQQFISPEWYAMSGSDTLSVAFETLPLTVFNDVEESVPRLMAVAIKGVEVKPSPVWLQCALVRMGGKPINNIVDATNYVMLMTAQPTHAYDYDKLSGATLGARMANPGEKATLLNGKTYELTQNDIAIVDGSGIIGLGGIMGGGNSEVSNDTRNLVLEVANFDMYTVRKSSMRHGVFTDALARFNKGQSPYQNSVILTYLATLMLQVAGGSVASTVYDKGNGFDRGYETSRYGEVGNIDASFINERLGTELAEEEIATLLQNVEFDIDVDETGIDYRAPFWRTDIEQAEDIVEEVGRLYGFDKLPRELPLRSVAPVASNKKLEIKSYVRRMMRQTGVNEVLTYSFVHENIIKKAGQDASHAFKLSNALSPDLQYYRLSLTPSLLDKVHMNIRAGYDHFGLFEVNKVHYKGEMDEHEPDVPNEDEHVACIIAYGDKKAPHGAAFYHARAYVERIIDVSAYQVVPLTRFDISTDEWGQQLTAPYEPSRSIVLIKDGQIWGVIGEFKRDVAAEFKLPAFCAGFEMHMDLVTGQPENYRPLSKYPSVIQDISIRVNADVSYETVYKSVSDALSTFGHPLEVDLRPIDIYMPDDANEKTTTFRITVASHESTLRDDDVRPIVEAISIRVEQDLGGRVV